MNDPVDHEVIIHRFEQAWQSGIVPEIHDFIPKVIDSTQRNKLAIELVCVDLEYRWKNESTSQESLPISLEQYAVLFGHNITVNNLPIEIIAEEYRVRCLWGDRPSHDSFLDLFSHRKTELANALLHIDRENQIDKQQTSSKTTAEENTNKPTIPHHAVTNIEATLKYDQYLLQKMIGAGRMGRVYRAWDKIHEHPVAVKYLRKTFQESPDAVKRFTNEAKTVLRFNHAGIVKTTGFGTTPGGGYFIVMELIEEPNLSVAIETGPASIKESMEWIIQLCQALEHAHTKGIIHCDLKPANLLLDADRTIRVTDFGLSRSTYSEEQESDRIEGTAAFMAPEQISRWWGSISPQTDIYGAGAVLFNLLTGQAPFGGTTLGDILAQVVSGIPVCPPKQLRPDMSPTLNSICLRCLSKTPNDRFNNVGELRHALEEEITSL